MASLTTVDFSDCLTQTTSPLIASSLALTAQRPTEQGAWRLSISQPLRVEAGNLRFDYPTAITPTDKIHYESLNASLTPSARQLDLEISYQHRLATNMSVGLGLWVTENPGHVQGAGAQSGVVVALKAKF